MKRRIAWFRILAPILTVLWIGFIFSRSLKTGNESHTESTFYLDRFRSVFPGISMVLVRKGAHFLEFFVLGLLLFWDFRLLWRRSAILPALCGLLIAASDELLQSLTPERSCEWKDILLDFSGVAAACLLAWLISFLWEKRRIKRE